MLGNYAEYFSFEGGNSDNEDNYNIEKMLDEETLSRNQGTNEPLMFHCGICYEDYDLGERDVAGLPVYQVKMLDSCKHTFCHECFEETFRVLIED